MRRTMLVPLLLWAGVPALACTCVVTQPKPTLKTLMADDAIVFRGVVTERKTLASQPEMRGRNRYSITFLVEEYWKGSPGRTVVIYDLDPGTDCLGNGEYQVGKTYLVFAQADQAKDVVLDGFFWYGWKDILPEGSAMLLTNSACMPAGEVSEKLVRAALDELGPGRLPPKEAQ